MSVIYQPVGRAYEYALLAKEAIHDQEGER